MTAISVSERLLEMAAFYTWLDFTLTLQISEAGGGPRQGNDMAIKKSIAAVRHTNSDALIFYAIVLAHGKAAGQPQDNAPRYPAMV